jgi:Mn2+/Fe2+ NRAMP family transporter
MHGFSGRHMPTRKAYEAIVAAHRRRRWVLYCFAGVFAALGLGTGRWVGGSIAQFAGRAQFISVVIVLFAAAVIILFASYGSTVNAFLARRPLVFLRVAIANCLAVFALLAIGFTLWSMVASR